MAQFSGWRGVACVLIALPMLAAGCLDDECDEVLEPDLQRREVCMADPARCTFARDVEPDRVLAFAITLATTDASGKPVANSTLRRNARCIKQFLQERSVTRIAESAASDRLDVVSTYRRVGPALDLKVVSGFDLKCPAPATGVSGCDVCALKAAEACAADPFCVAVMGQTVDATRMCLPPAAVVACGPADLGCDGALTWAQPTGGACTLFPTTCIPAGFTATAPGICPEVPACPP